MRILVDQSGYDLVNLGDVAMLQSCVARLQMQWPDAEILVITHEPRRLAQYCPGIIPVRVLADMPLFRRLPRKPRIGSEQIWRIVAPYFSFRSRRPGTLAGQPRTVVQAVHAADLVVGSGGAYLTDTWWCHAVGVLSLFSLAQRLGKPTAMFGQGIGPMQLAPLRAHARTVLPKLMVLGLRESSTGRDLALSLGVAQDSIRVTGDDALELIRNTDVADGNALGISIRVSNYAGIDLAAAEAIAHVLLNMAARLDAPIIGLPVSKYEADADVLRTILQAERRRADIAIDDIGSPEALISAAAKCRAIATGSYHAALFGLAQGVPTVCLTKSAYYDAKFGGLQALFPQTCFVVPLNAPDFSARLRTTLQQAWSLSASARATAAHTASRLRDDGRDAYAQFRIAADGELTKVTAAGREGGV